MSSECPEAEVLKKRILSRRFAYPKLIGDPRVQVAAAGGHRDINFFIGVRGRLPYLATCLKYLKAAVSACDAVVRIIVVENDEIPRLADFAAAYGADYVFLPFGVSNSAGLYSRGLAYNVGFKAVPQARWSVFHDADLLVPADFFELLEHYLQAEPKWLQPYTDRRVTSLTPGASEYVMYSDAIHDLYGIQDFYLTGQGAPGGSIVVRDDVFVRVGGYDPELFYGYAPEDSFFWTKLELLCQPLDVVTNCHNGAGIYADDPPMRLYHLFHPPAISDNPDHDRMVEDQSMFWALPYDQKMQIVDLKEELFASGGAAARQRLEVDGSPRS